jgi:hypothetical protein
VVLPDWHDVDVGLAPHGPSPATSQVIHLMQTEWFTGKAAYSNPSYSIASSGLEPGVAHPAAGLTGSIVADTSRWLSGARRMGLQVHREHLPDGGAQVDLTCDFIVSVRVRSQRTRP